MKRAAALLAILVLATLAAPAQEVRLPSPREVVGPPRGEPVTGAELQAKTKEVASLLRCPVCQGLSIYDSPATMAVNMRHQVEDLVAAGYDRDQILEYFEASYGEFVRLQPKMRGMNWIVWAAPAVLAAIGAWAVFAFLRRSQRTPSESATGEALPPIDPRLEPYVRRVRELAYGPPQEMRTAK
ncbi:MAG: cytochrome c-type biogenesis protein [Thermoanaerobaculia bacterium]